MVATAMQATASNRRAGRFAFDANAPPSSSLRSGAPTKLQLFDLAAGDRTRLDRYAKRTGRPCARIAAQAVREFLDRAGVRHTAEPPAEHAAVPPGVPPTAP